MVFVKLRERMFTKKVFHGHDSTSKGKGESNDKVYYK